METLHGTTPFDRLRRRYERTAKRCSACGNDERDPEWTCTTDGSQVIYRFVCSSCSAVHQHTFHR